MSGIVKNNLELIGGVASTADTHTITDTADIQIFTTTGSNRTWAKPSWANTVYIECIGAGGGEEVDGKVQEVLLEEEEQEGL